jgi:ABC-2 type transport system permease protein
MSFDKILIILRREYLTRVRTKAFIISTILAPVFILALIGIPILLSFLETDRPNRIGVQDETGTLVNRFMEIDSTRYQPLADEPIDTLRAMVLGGRIDGYILLNETHISGDSEIEFMSGGKGGLSLMSDIRNVRISVDLRPTVDVERLMCSWWYPLGRGGLMACDYVDRASRAARHPRSWVRRRAALRGGRAPQ